LIEPHRLSHGPTAPIHIGLRLQEDHLISPYLTISHGRCISGPGQSNAVTMSELVHHSEAHIVSISLVSSPRVAKAKDQKHAIQPGQATTVMVA